MLHHVSIRTADIFRSIAFYEQIGFVMEQRFTAGSTLACWMVGTAGTVAMGGRLELLQIPEPNPAADAFGDEHYVGYYHLSFDLTGDLTGDLTALGSSLPDWLTGLQDKLQAIDQELTVLLQPQQQMIGDRLYEVAFIADPDGLPIEFLRTYGVTAAPA
jgi:catechol 2,3-dioxygenase-like lactoylglutathione lyase family enzyme